MRVLYWTDWYLPHIGGVETFSARLLPEVVRRGHEVTVVAGHHASGFPDMVDWEGVTVRRFPFHPVLAAGDVRRTLEVLRDVALLKQAVQPDVVHLNTLGPSVLFHLETARRSPTPVLLTMHSPVMDDASRTDTLYGRALRSPDRVNCNSRAVHADLCARVPELRDRASVTYYGMDPPAVEPAPRPRERPVVLGYGRMVADKGFDVALRAFDVVRRRHPSAHLRLVGDGAARPELEGLVKELDLRDSVTFTGAVEPGRIPQIINESSLVVVPSRWNEPFGLVALEAALMARPVVAARVGGLPEVVEEGLTGLLVPREDHVALAEAVVYLLHNFTEADHMGEIARERARARFSWFRCVDEYERLYDQTRHADIQEQPGHDHV